MARTRSSEREREETRVRILAAAHSVFAERGYRAATLDSIARASQLTRAGLLHHFSGKQELLLALLDARDEELQILDADPADGQESVSALLLTIKGKIRAILAQRELVALAHALSAEAADPGHPAHEWLTRRYDRLRTSLADAFSAAFARGELVGREDPALLAALSLAATEGLEAQWLADPAAVDVERGVELLNTLILARLRP